MLWACKTSISGEKCKVNWANVCHPKGMGGFRVFDLDKFLERFGYAGYGLNGWLPENLGWA
jgi:hypothetical protein